MHEFTSNSNMWFGLSLDTRLWLDGFDDGKDGFIRRIKRSFKATAEAYHKEPRFEEDGDSYSVKPYPMSDIAFSINLEELWDSYKDGESFQWMEFQIEQGIRKL